MVAGGARKSKGELVMLKDRIGVQCAKSDEAWMTQVARNLTDAGDGFLHGVQYLILDRDPLL